MFSTRALFCLLTGSLLAVSSAASRPAAPGPATSERQPSEAEAERLYRQGLAAADGVQGPIDEAKALRLFRQAEKRGHVLAATRVGSMLYHGIAVKPDRDEGTRKVRAVIPRLRRKAEEGNADAQTLLGGLYRDGPGVEPDNQEAVRWYRQAADKGEPWGMYNLGAMYANGFGVGKNPKEALRWFRKAAAAGNPMAREAVKRLEAESGK
jgi:TPR repeat protein